MEKPMSITARCTIEQGMIRLPRALPLPDGMKVIVTVEPVLSVAQRKKIARELAGSWGEDSSIAPIFEEIDEERHAYHGRDVQL
jgi:hypothetical protein